MPKDSPRRRELLAEVEEKFGAVIGKGPGKVPINEAARKLNVSRQTVHRYLNGTVMPRGEVLIAALKAFGLVVRYRDVNVTASFLPMEAKPPASRPPAQMDFFEAFDSIRDRDLEVKIGRRSADAIELSVKIRFAG